MSKLNPAAQLAFMWFYTGNGKGSKNMVILPYKDRLELFPSISSSSSWSLLAKKRTLPGNIVNQGIYRAWQQGFN